MGENGQFIIGLTGSIGVGKSLVRKMLMHQGAMGLDADSLAHDSYARGAPAYEAILEAFGKGILNPEGSINRQELGKQVFRSPIALKHLEEIVHPLVIRATRNITRHSTLPIVVIEAIKLLESDLAGLCDSIWVVDAPIEKIQERLSFSRGITRVQIEDRLKQQSSPEEKIRKADVVINNSGDVRCTWDDIQTHWKNLSKSHARFCSAERDTQSLIAPYQKFLIHPLALQAEKLASWLEQQPAILDSYLFNCTNREFSVGAVERLGWVQFAHYLLCEFFFAQSPDNDIDGGLICWDMGHLALHAAWMPVFESIPSRTLQPIFEMIESFARLHMCREITLPVPNQFKDELEEIGFQIQPDDQTTGFQKPGSGYNQYQKVLKPVMEIFNNLEEQSYV